MNTNTIMSLVESSKKYSGVPAGVRVLVVDVDSTCLEVVSALLRALEYEVKTVERAEDALYIIREKKDEIDLVLMEFHMPDMNGLELIERIDKETKLPVVVMSADDNEQVMLHCILKGAQMYMIKPLSLDEAMTLWQFTITKRKDMARMEKYRKGSPEENHGEEIQRNRLVIVKKSKLIWTKDLHRNFLDAVEEIGINRAHPKQILEYMNIPGLTKENISSHLQKYRMSMKKEQERGKSIVPDRKKTTKINESTQSSYGRNGPSSKCKLRGRSPLRPHTEKSPLKFGDEHSSSNFVGDRISGGNIGSNSKRIKSRFNEGNSGVWERKP